MNSDIYTNAIKLIEDIFDLTNEEVIRTLIDEPVEKTIIDFKFEYETPLNYHAFIKCTGSFIAAVYKNISWIIKKPSEEKSCAEAISILETSYQSSNDRGFYAAFLDINNPQRNGPEIVLFQLSQIIKERLKLLYQRWIYASRIDTADWETRCLVAEIIIEKWRPFLPPYILMRSPAQFADYIPDLINTLVTSDNSIIEMLVNNTNWDTFEC